MSDICTENHPPLPGKPSALDWKCASRPGKGSSIFPRSLDDRSMARQLTCPSHWRRESVPGMLHLLFLFIRCTMLASARMLVRQRKLKSIAPALLLSHSRSLKAWPPGDRLHRHAYQSILNHMEKYALVRNLFMLMWETLPYLQHYRWGIINWKIFGRSFVADAENIEEISNRMWYVLMRLHRDETLLDVGHICRCQCCTFYRKLLERFFGKSSK